MPVLLKEATLDTASTSGDYITKLADGTRFFRVDKSTGRVGLGSRATPGNIPQVLMHIGIEDTSTDEVIEIERLERTTTGIAMPGIGARRTVFLQNSFGTPVEALREDVTFTVVDGMAEASSWSVFMPISGLMTEKLRSDDQFYLDIFGLARATHLVIGTETNVFTDLNRLHINDDSGPYLTLHNSSVVEQMSIGHTPTGDFALMYNAHQTVGFTTSFNVTKQSWRFGVLNSDEFTIDRAPATGGAITWTNFLRISSAGTVGIGMESSSETPSARLHIVKNDASTNTALELLRLDRRTTGIASHGIGAAISFHIEDNTGAINEYVQLRSIAADIGSGNHGTFTVFTRKTAGLPGLDMVPRLEITSGTGGASGTSFAIINRRTDGVEGPIAQIGNGTSGANWGILTLFFNNNFVQSLWEWGGWTIRGPGADDFAAFTPGKIVFTKSVLIGGPTPASAPATTLHVKRVDSSTNVAIEITRLERLTTGAAAVGIGLFSTWFIQDASGTSVEAFREIVDVEDVATATFSARVKYSMRINGTTVNLFQITKTTDAAGVYDIKPQTDNEGNLGTDTLRWRRVRAVTVTSGDLQLVSDDGKSDWTLREGEECLWAINNRTGKKYQVVLKEVQ